MNKSESFTVSIKRAVRKGFTLTELLLVIIIIAILAAMTLSVQRGAVLSTRRERTVATIRKIDTALTAAYEKYQYRKPDVSYFVNQLESALAGRTAELSDREKMLQVYARLLQRIRNTYAPWLERNITFGEEGAVDVQFTPYILRTIMLRELLVADFPNCLAEVAYEMHLNDSAVHKVYQKYYDRLQAGLAQSKSDDISADLLYLIVMNTSPDTRGTFLEREIADTNGNGIPEFIDGWGSPIRFIRWAPSLSNSNRQATLNEGIVLGRYRSLKRAESGGIPLENTNSGDYASDPFYSENRDSYPASDWDFVTYFEEYYPGLLDSATDPFDPMGSMNGWLLTPLIYSPGPDREYGLPGMENYGLVCTPFGEDALIGDDADLEAATDNITNHNLE